MQANVSDSHLMARSTPRPVWRIALLWKGTVLDVVTLERARGSLRLRTGEVLRVRALGAGLEVTVPGEPPFVVDAAQIGEGAHADLPAGHALVASREIPEARVGGLSAVDSTLFHATMIGVAVQACVVSALVLAPAPAFDSEAGAGVPGPWRRYLVSPGGTAPHTGPASLSMVGRPPDEVERPAPERRRGRRPDSRTGQGMTLEQALDEMNRALHLGDDGTELKEAIGDWAQAVARAPVSGADFGGLAPKDPATAGPGNGLVGAGESHVMQALKRRIQDNLKQANAMPVQAPRPAIPVKLMEVPATDIKLAPDEGFDPVVKDTLFDAVKRRDNAVRACYEDRGLRMDKSRAGRLTLELTLLPDGHVERPTVEVSSPELAAVGDCVRERAGEWFLGGGLVDAPTRMKFPFILTPHNEVQVFDFSG